MSEPTAPAPGRAPAAPPAGTRTAEGRVTITAPAERVWKALTDAEELTRWFPLDARVEPGPGGTVYMSWRNEFAAEMKILVWDPPHHLRTAWAFHQGEEPAQVTDYLIETTRGTTTVRAVTSGFPLDASWDGWVEGTIRGWAFELRSLRHYLERHAGEPRHVAYVRRRVPLTPADAWARLAADRELGPWLTAGRAFDASPGRQYAAVADDPADAMFRVSVEPAGPGSPQPEVVFFLSAWGDQTGAVDAIRGTWARGLERLYPDGVTP
jgi:uncharacterized protein YndB with AHSA1/START domain